MSVGTSPRVARLQQLIQPVRLRSSIRLDRPASWLELFFDLIFVAAVAQLSFPLAESYSLGGLLRFVFFFVLVWWAWFDHTLFCSRFHIDDGLQRAMTLAQIFVVAVMAANAKAAITSRDAAGFVAAFGVMRLILMLQYLRARRSIQLQHVLNSQTWALGVSGFMWLTAALLPTPHRFVVWTIALTIDSFGPWMRRHATSTIPPDTAHLPERYGLFTIILLGEFVASVMRGMEAQESWPLLAFTAALCGFCLAFVCWWIYFEHCGAAEASAVPKASSPARFHVWLYLHLPFYLSLAVTGVGFEHFVAGRHFATEEIVLMLASVGVLITAMWMFARTARQRLT